jgi:hypothetical protein
MTSNRHKYFRWTPRTARITFVYAIVVPAIVGYFSYTTDVSEHLSSNLSPNQIIRQVVAMRGTANASIGKGKWDLRAKRRGDVISEF